MTTIESKFAGHQERAIQMGECIPPWLWLADDGTHEGYIFWAELLDGMKCLADYCSVLTDEFLE